jgi:hypothetical protein
MCSARQAASAVVIFFIKQSPPPPPFNHLHAPSSPPPSRLDKACLNVAPNPSRAVLHERLQSVLCIGSYVMIAKICQFSSPLFTVTLTRPNTILIAK